MTDQPETLSRAADMEAAEMVEILALLEWGTYSLARRLDSDPACLRRMLHGQMPVRSHMALWLRLHRAFLRAFARPVPWNGSNFDRMSPAEVAKRAEMRQLLAQIEGSPRLPAWDVPPRAR